MSDSVGSVSVDVVPDARGWSEKLRAQIRDQQVKVKADADTAEAEAKLDETARTRTAKIKADTSQLSRASGFLDQFIGKLGLLPALALTAGSALIPLAGAIGGVVAAIGAPLAIAGGGATLFAFLGGAAVAQTKKQLKNISSLQSSLNGMTKGTDAYIAKQKELKAAQAALTPAQVTFASSLDKVKAAFGGLLEGKNGQALLGPISAGLALLAKILPALEPIIRSVSGAFTSLLEELSGATAGAGFERFVQRMARQVGPDIKIFGHIIGELAKGIGGLFLALDNRRASGSVLKGLEGITSNFAAWANSRSARHDVREFFRYFHEVGPQVAHTIGAVASSLGHIVKALAPLGPPVLKVVEGIASAISSIPVPVLTALAGATAGLVAFQKLGGFKATGFLGKGLGSGSGGRSGGLLGGLIGSAKPVPVFVTNPGFGGAGVPGGGGPLGDAEKAANKAGPLKYVPQAALLAATGYEGYVATKGIVHNLSQAPKGYGLGAPTLGSSAPSSGAHINYGKLAMEANGYLTSTSNRFDALRTHAAQASRQIDLIGPRTQQAAGVGIKAIDALQGRLDAVHDKKFAVIAQTQSAVASLERLQAMRIADKHFTVYQRNQLLEQAVGPGGGRGRPNPGGSGGGGGGGGGGTPVHIHLDDNGRDTLTGVIQRNYDANRDFERNHG